jgi:hypothetical protein
MLKTDPLTPTPLPQGKHQRWANHASDAGDESDLRG